MINLRAVSIAFVLMLGTTGASAATLDVSGGQLLGAFDVAVGSNLYDVEFLDGSCVALYSGCDSVSDFTFKSEAAAQVASQALLDQVFLDGVPGQFDTDPELTNGCASTSVCEIVTPYGFDFSGDPNFTLLTYAAQNFSGASADSLRLRTLDPTRNLGTSFVLGYARWTLVPEPSTALLLAAGLTVLSARRRNSAR